MKRQAIVVVLLSALLSLSLSAGDTAVPKLIATFTDPVGDVTGREGEPPPIDVVQVDLSSDAPSVPAKGKVYTGKIAYTSIGVKSGQTIRVIARELDDQGERAGMFPDALLKVK